MSSGFVSGGTTDAPIQRSDAWLAAQLELEAERKRKADAAKAQAEGRSLYETLEANKAAKQAAFEEANRLKNQFRALDDDEIAFLDEIMDSTRKREAEIKKETLEGLAAFRKRQEELDRLKTGDGAEEPDVMAPKDEWAHAGRKRRREREGLVKGIKLRKGSAGAAAVASVEEGTEHGVTPSAKGPTESSESKAAEPPKKQGEAEKGDAKVDELSEKPDEETAAGSGSAIGKTDKDLRKGGSGLVDYGSDDDDW